MNELTRLARKHGCRILRHGSAHDEWVNPGTGQTSWIPRHPGKELPTGTAKQIMKSLGLK
ncbi:MAG: type II toxin-antitoxin system HicA family toxin [Oscillospiraceae bacterium]|nr:type II toxin-antitoxin system HicA family toxin [Oscillospiraceae bacterium]